MDFDPTSPDASTINCLHAHPTGHLPLVDHLEGNGRKPALSPF